MTKLTHVHKLKRLRYKTGNAIFFCCLPDCSFKINTALALGKRAICWLCGESFIMDEYNLRLAKPHCKNCHKSKDKKIRIDGPYIGKEGIEEALNIKLPNSLEDKGPSIFGLTKEIRKAMQEPVEEKLNEEEPEI